MTTAENPFAALAARTGQTDQVTEPSVTAPTETVPATVNPFDSLRAQAAVAAPCDIDPDEAYVESLADEIIETPEEAPAQETPAAEDAPEPEKKPRKKRATRRSVAPESAQPKPVEQPSADDLTTLALTKGADTAWIELTEIIEHADTVESRRASLADQVDEAQRVAAEAISRVEEAQKRRARAEEALKAAQKEFEESTADLAEATTERDEIIEKGSALFDEFDALTKEAETLGDRATKARATREAVITYLTALTGGKSGTFGNVRVTFIDGNPYIEQVTPAATPGEDTNA